MLIAEMATPSLRRARRIADAASLESICDWPPAQNIT